MLTGIDKKIGFEKSVAKDWNDDLKLKTQAENKIEKQKRHPKEF